MRFWFHFTLPQEGQLASPEGREDHSSGRKASTSHQEQVHEQPLKVKRASHVQALSLHLRSSSLLQQALISSILQMSKCRSERSEWPWPRQDHPACMPLACMPRCFSGLIPVTQAQCSMQCGRSVALETVTVFEIEAPLLPACVTPVPL